MITRTRLALAAGAAAFSVAAILNCGGYRFGIGDQAFYVPAVAQHLNPALFPRDRVLLHAQDRFMIYDEIFAGLSAASGISIPVWFFSAYVVGLVLLFGAAVSIGRALYGSWWTVAAFTAVLTLRHRITQTGANSLEAYFQPRMLAFAFGAWAIAAYLRGRHTLVLLMVALAFAIHPTTGLWFGVFVGAALLATEAKWRRRLLASAGALAAAGTWAVMAGPLQGRLAVMDGLWASAMAGKDYIFPSDWNVSFWMVNFSYLPVAGAIFVLRKKRGVTTDREAGLLAGAAGLVCVFLASLPLLWSHVALALQLQVSRVFWIVDFVAAAFIAWIVVEGVKSPVLSRALAVIVMAIAVGRGLFVWGVEHSGSPLVELQLPADAWTDAMAWVARTPEDTHVLADPGHAWKYGSSVRVAGQRDVFVEEVKDLALALYSRDVAVSALERINAVGRFDALTPPKVSQLARRYDLDYLVAERDLPLPVAYRNERFRIYALQRYAAK